MKNCSYCGRENTEDATQCGGCGTELAGAEGSSPALAPLAPYTPTRTPAEKLMFYGAIWCAGGILVTVLTYVAAASHAGGGTYFVAWGAIIFGAAQFVRGLSSRNEQPNTEDHGYDALSAATRLETEGRIEEAKAAYQNIAERYANTNAGRDAQKSLESLRANLG